MMIMSREEWLALKRQDATKTEPAAPEGEPVYRPETPLARRKRLEGELVAAQRTLAGLQAQVKRGRPMSPTLQAAMGKAAAECRRLQNVLDRLHQRRHRSTAPEQEEPQ
jgi:hypothetical protein